MLKKYPAWEGLTILVTKAYDKTNRVACEPSEDSDSLTILFVWSVFTVHAISS